MICKERKNKQAEWNEQQRVVKPWGKRQLIAGKEDVRKATFYTAVLIDDDPNHDDKITDLCLVIKTPIKKGYRFALLWIGIEKWICLVKCWDKATNLRDL